jgi:hypothetical protein
MGCIQSSEAAAEEAPPPPSGISDERRQEAIRDDKRYSDFVVPEAVLIDTAKCVRPLHTISPCALAVSGAL